MQLAPVQRALRGQRRQGLDGWHTGPCAHVGAHLALNQISVDSELLGGKLHACSHRWQGRSLARAAPAAHPAMPAWAHGIAQGCSACRPAAGCCSDARRLAASWRPGRRRAHQWWAWSFAGTRCGRSGTGSWSCPPPSRQSAPPALGAQRSAGRAVRGAGVAGERGAALHAPAAAPWSPTHPPPHGHGCARWAQHVRSRLPSSANHSHRPTGCGPPCCPRAAAPLSPKPCRPRGRPSQLKSGGGARYYYKPADAAAGLHRGARGSSGAPPWTSGSCLPRWFRF